MRSLIIFFFFLSFGLVKAQNINAGYKLFFEHASAGKFDDALTLGSQLITQMEKDKRPADTTYANIAYYMGYIYFSQQQYEKALEYGNKDMAARKKMKVDSQYYQSLYMVTAYYGHLEKFDQAIPPMQEIVDYATQQYGADDKNTIQMNYQLATIYQNGGYVYDAERIYENNYERVKKNYTPTDSMYQATVNAIYLFYYNTGNFRKAEPFYVNALKELEKQFGGKENANYLNQLHGLIQFYVNGNMYKEAARTYKEYLVLLAKVIGGKENEEYMNALADYTQVCLAVPDYEKAGEAYQEQLALTEKIKGTRKDTAYINLLNETGEFYIHAGLYQEAEKIYGDYVKTVIEFYGKNSADHATALNNLAVVYEKSGKNAEAEKLYLETLKIKEKVFKKESNYYALTLVNLGVLYDNMGRYKDAEKLLEQAVQIYEKVYGGQSDNYATALNSIASVYSSGGKTKQAIAYMEKALEISKKTNGEESQQYIMSLSNLATIHVDLGEYAKAEAEFTRAIQLGEKVLGTQHTDVGTGMFNLANLKTSLGKYQEAEKLLQQSLAIQQKAVGEKHARYISTLQSQASLYATIGRYNEAEKTYARCESLMRKVQGERHPEFAILLHNMSWFYAEKADYNKAEKYIDKAILIQRDHFGADHPDNIPVLSTKANISLAKGDPKTAETNLLAASKIAREHYGEQHPDYAMILNNLGNMYRSLGNYELAKTNYERSMDLRQKIYGEEHAEYATSLNNLGALYLSMATDARDEKEMRKNAILATSFFKQAIHIDSLQKNDQPDMAGHLNNLAEAYRLTNEPALAEKNYLRAVEIEKKYLGNNNAQTAVTYHNLALLYAGMNNLPKGEEYALKAVSIFDKNFGVASPAAAGVTSSLAYIYELQGKNDKALQQYDLANTIQQKTIDYNFTFLSEEEKEKFLSSVSTYKDMFNSFALKYGKEKPEVYAKVYDQALKNKGILFRSSAHMKEVAMASGDTALISLYNRWNNLKKELAVGIVIPEEGKRDPFGEYAKNEELANSMEKELVAKTGTTNEENVQWMAIRNKLQTGQVAIEFIDFVQHDEKKEHVYCALVLKPGMQQPGMIKLCYATDLEKVIGKFGANNYEYVTGIYGKRSDVSDALYQLVWKPLETQLQGVKEVYYSPSGLLNKISFAALADEKKVFLSDKYVLQTVTSTARLLDNTTGDLLPGKPLMAVYGGVKYGDNQTKTEIWKYLPGTLAEAEKIGSLMAKNNVLTETITGEKATEAEIKKHTGNYSPSILHVATHGFFYADPGEVQGDIKTETAQVDFRGGSRGVRTFVENPNPLMRSGIVLAGANNVWNEDGTANNAAEKEDGVLTAYEVSLMNLKETKLTVLSACETGLGDIKGSEGVYGLQRAFRMAGSRYVMMSLWQVPDKETEEFMVSFYTSLVKSKSIKKAFTEAQTTMRKKYDPYFWAAFVLME